MRCKGVDHGEVIEILASLELEQTVGAKYWMYVADHLCLSMMMMLIGCVENAVTRVPLGGAMWVEVASKKIT
jgi:hypothetical protein